jgi:hypothetical protein
MELMKDDLNGKEKGVSKRGLLPKRLSVKKSSTYFPQTPPTSNQLSRFAFKADSSRQVTDK